MSDSNNRNSHSGDEKRAAFFAVYPVVVLPMFIAMMDQTIVTTALPAIAGELGSVERISYVVIAYLISSTVAALLYGRAGDAFGRRLMLLVAISVVLAGSILCAVAQSVEMLVLARLLQGLGGGGLMSLSQALVGETIPPRVRAQFQGYLAGIGIAASCIGPLVGGLLTEHFGWRSVFCLNIPLCALAGWLIWRLPKTAGSGVKFQLDTLGLLLFSALVVTALVGVGQLQGAATADIGSGLWVVALALMLGLAFVRWQLKAQQPFVPLAVLANPSVWLPDVMSAFHGAAIIALLSYLPVYFLVVHGASPSEFGLLMIPFSAGIGVGSVITGKLMAKTQRTMLFPSVAMWLPALALLLIAIAGERLPAVWLSAVLGVSAVFLGSVGGAVQITVQLAAGRANIGVAVATVQVARSLGSGIGAALVGAVLFSALNAIDPAALQWMQSLLKLQAQQGGLSQLEQHLMRGEVVSAFRWVFACVALFCVAIALAALRVPLRRLDEVQ